MIVIPKIAIKFERMPEKFTLPPDIAERNVVIGEPKIRIDAAKDTGIWAKLRYHVIT